MDNSSAKKSIARDTLLYLPAKALEGIIGIIALKVYAIYIVPSNFGNYTLINTSVTITSLFVMGWLLQSAFRYINSFNTHKKMRLFYSTAFVPWLVINGVIFTLGIIASALSVQFYGPRPAIYILLGVLMFSAYTTVQILYSLLGALRRIKLNLSISLFAICSKLALMLILVNTLIPNELSIVASTTVIDGIAASIIIVRLKLYKYINIKLFSKKIFRKFWRYGTPLVGLSITMSLLALSDRYIIKFWLGSEPLGIYSANYSVASAIFTVIMFAIMRGVYPMLLKTWKQNDKQQTEVLLSQGVRYYLLITVPAAVGLGVLSKSVSLAFLSPEYSEGSSVIIWVSAGMFLLGLTEYSNKAWELNSNTKYIFRNSVISGAVNVIANIVFIPLYGYKVAAVTTALAYMLNLALSLTGSRKILKWNLPLTVYLRIGGSAAVMGVVLALILSVKVPSGLFVGCMVAIGTIVYGIALAVTGEVRGELKYVTTFVRNRTTRD